MFRIWSSSVPRGANPHPVLVPVSSANRPSRHPAFPDLPSSPSSHFPSQRLFRGESNYWRSNLLSVHELEGSAQHDLCVFQSDRKSKRFYLPNGRFPDPGRTRTRSAQPENVAGGQRPSALRLPGCCVSGSGLYTYPRAWAVARPVAIRHRSIAKTRATATIAFLRARAPAFLSVRILCQRFTAWQSG